MYRPLTVQPQRFTAHGVSMNHDEQPEAAHAASELDEAFEENDAGWADWILAGALIALVLGLLALLVKV